MVYDKSEPVLYRKDADAENLDGIHFCFGEHAFISEESEDYEFYILNNNCDSQCWIILDVDGTIRVWDRTMEELFFGKEAECVYEKTDKGRIYAGCDIVVGLKDRLQRADTKLKRAWISDEVIIFICKAQSNEILRL